MSLSDSRHRRASLAHESPTRGRGWPFCRQLRTNWSRGAGIAAAIAASFATTAAQAQDEWRIAIQRLQQQLGQQQRQIDSQSRTIESQQRQIEEQSHELDEIRRSSHPRPTVRDRASADSGKVLSVGEVEPAELLVQPLPVPSRGTPSFAAHAVPPRHEHEVELKSGENPNAAASQAAGAQFGYSNGFFIASPDPVEASAGVPFLLQVNGRLQLRHTAFDSDGPTQDENDLELERARLVFSGQVFSPDFRYLAQLDGDTDDAATADFIDYNLTYDIGHALLDCETGSLAMKLGKYRLPFTRARQDSGFVLQFVDRATASEFFDINRSIAIGLTGKGSAFHRPVAWEVAISNGFRDDRFPPGRSEGLDRNPGYAARVSSELLGEWGTDGEPDLSWHECPAVKVGAAVAFTRVDRNDGLREFSTIPAIGDTGTNPFVVDVLPASVDEFGVLECAIDANFKYHGFTLLGEYYLRELTEFAGGPVPDLFDHGFVLQAGYFLVPKKLEVATRWSRVVGDSWTLGVSDHSSDEIASGMTWYIRGHNLKISCDVSHLNGSPIGSPTLNILAGDDGWLFRTQFQLMF